MPNFQTCEEPPTVVARYSPPKTIGVQGFSFPIYCVVKNRKGKRENRVFQTWQPQKVDGGFGCSIVLKEWNALNRLPPKIKKEVEAIMVQADEITVATQKQVVAIGKQQSKLWSNAFKEKKPVARPYDIKRKKRIEK